MISKKLVLMDHDGAIDDFLAMTLLMKMPNIEHLGVVVTPADCYIKSAVSVTRKILDLMGKNQIPVAESTARGVNPFPSSFRKDSLIIDNFPLLNEQEEIKTPLAREIGQEFTIKVLQEATDPVTLLVTGPLTTLATALDIAPEIENKIKEIVWMGGALNVSGNVSKEHAPEHDGSAEWNVYWDPFAAYRIWQSRIPVILCPLDVTNNVPLTPEFIRQLAKQRHYPLSDLAGLCYSLAIPQHYYCWDLVATVYLDCPEFYEIREEETTIITTGLSQGQSKIELGARKIKVMEKMDTEKFYDYLLTQWKS